MNYKEQETTTKNKNYPLTVSKQTPLSEVIELMTQERQSCNLGEHLSKTKNHSCVVVVEAGKPVGIVTERDLVRLAASNTCIDTMRVEEVMTKKLITLEEKKAEDLFHVIDLLRHHHIRHLPVVDQTGFLVGVLTRESIREKLQPADLLRLCLISEVMTKKVIQAKPTASVQNVAQLMSQHRVSCVIITKQEPEIGTIPVGIITEKDIVQIQALKLELNVITAQTVMSSPPFCLSPDDPLWRANTLMETKLIRHLVITGEKGELLGIISQSSILQVLDPVALFNVIGALNNKVNNLEVEKMDLLKRKNTELETKVGQRTAELAQQSQFDSLLAEISQRIRQSLELETILQTAVDELRKILDTDRVIIYRFNPDWTGEVAVESVKEQKWAIFGQTFNDPCFEQGWAEKYIQGRMLAIADLKTSEYSPCHVEFLEKIDVKGQIVVPLLQGSKLWGLLIIYSCEAPRNWSEPEALLVQKVSIQLAIAIEQAELYKQAQIELKQRQQTEITLQKLIQGTAAVTGERFFSQLLYYLAQILDISYASVAEIKENGFETIAFWSNEELQPLTTQLNSQVCHQALQQLQQFLTCENQFCEQSHLENIYVENPDFEILQAESCVGTFLYNAKQEIIGKLCVINKRPIENAQQAKGILATFAARAGSELERLQTARKLEQLNAELEARVKQRTVELQQREEQLQDFFDNANDLIQSVSLIDASFLYVNRAWRETLGYTAAEIKQLTIFDVLTPNCYEHCQQAIAQIKAGVIDSLDNIELTFLTKDKQEVIVEGSANIRYENNQPVATRAIFRDITQRKKAELQLQQSKEFLQLILDSVPQRIFWKDRLGCYLGCNHNYANDANLNSPQEIIGKNDFDLIWKQYAQDFQRNDLWVMENNQAKINYEEKILREDGSFSWLLKSKIPLYDENGEVIGVLGTYEDITERKQAEIELQNLTNRLELSLKSGAIACWNWDIINNVLTWDERMYKLYGIEPSDFPENYRDLLSILHREDRANAEIAIKKALQGEKEFDIEFRVVHPDGSIRYLQASGLVQRNEIGEPQQIIGINFDVTESRLILENLKQAKEAAEKANQTKSDFLAMMSHEIRTPMNAVMGFSHLALQTELNDQQQEYIENIQVAANSLLQIINDILDFSKIEANKLELESSEFKLETVINNVTKIVGLLAEEKGLKLSYHLDSAIPPLLKGDCQRLRQILLNLTNNAIKFTEQGEISITTEKIAQTEEVITLRFTIKDTGMGISSEQLKKLFQPFSQVDSSRTRKYGGTGLGLVICKRLIEMMNGRIWVESELGKGSGFKFEIQLDLVSENLNTLPNCTKQEKYVNYEEEIKLIAGAKILVVEDNKINQTIAKKLLEKVGMVVKIANDGNEAIDLVKNHKFDLIFMDVLMPNLDGISATRQLRNMFNPENLATEYFATVPIIAMTGNVLNDDEEECLAAGMNDYIAKPIAPIKIYSALVRHLAAKSTNN